MKILVSTPDNSSSKDLASFFEGVSYLKRLGHNVTIDTDLKGKDEKEFFKKMEKAIKDTDIVLTEATNSDTKTGFEIARSLDEKKIVIVLEEEGKTKQSSAWIHTNNSKNLIFQKYSKKNNIQEIIDRALNAAKGQLDTKFILIISSEIDRYLDWAASTKRMHKAQIVRNAVEVMMKKDKEYKNYLAG